MGTYCCCGQRRSDKCLCNWTNWKEISSEQDLPKKDGVNLVRYTDNGGDRNERSQRFFLDLKVESNYFGNPVNIHWEFESWDDNYVTHWMELPELPVESTQNEKILMEELQSNAECFSRGVALGRKALGLPEAPHD